MLPSLTLSLWCLAAAQSTPADARSAYQLDAVPPGFSLQTYDDCGQTQRQPHVRCAGVHLYSPAECEADEKARSVAWDYKQLDATYEALDAKREHIVAIVYANEPFNPRVQSLWAGDIALHGPRPLPKGKAERLIFKVPPEAIRDGKLVLHFKLEGTVNVVVSAIELWAKAPSPKVLHIVNVSGLYWDLEGRVLDLAWDGAGDVPVELRRAGDDKAIATSRTRPDGWFTFERKLLEGVGRDATLEISARREGAVARSTLPASVLFFEPVRYRPIPTKTANLETSQISLDGEWRINPGYADDLRRQPLSAAGWGRFDVPGQWLQQGYDVPPEKTLAVAREFVVPAEWKANRVLLRFDAIHAGTQYWLNGKHLGRSENLFTPVEWDVTDACKLGETNRLDLAMTVNTVSETLSWSSAYAFHNLGGIDRSVRLYALPAVNIRSLRVTAELDKACRDGELAISLAIQNTGKDDQDGFEISATVAGADNAPSPCPPLVKTFNVGGRKSADVVLAGRANSPLQWSAEKPHLYKLVLELRKAGAVLERVERNIGFRRIEVRERQLYVNGKRIKLAGACRHELDPLTGRANTMKYAEQDVRLLKGANLNFIRTSHYPPTQELLDAADRIGMYVECEAPFCWVRDTWDMTHTDKVLGPTSAMIDYCHAHPCITHWSLANESAFCKFFKVSDKLCKDLDPTRPTTFNNPDPDRVCSIANFHYPPMPYDEAAKSEPGRPVLLGEYFFPVCHEQTDVRINPGLRELWAAGHAEPDSPYGKACAEVFASPVYLMPGAAPGMWTHVQRSDAVIGGAIWAALDEPFYLPGGKKAGYNWVHGPWGLIDGWRRPKPEWWLSKLVFSPVWFPRRQVEFKAGQETVRLPVENRYAFTDLSELKFTATCGEHKTGFTASLAPASAGEIELPVPQGTSPGDRLRLDVTDSGGEIVNALMVQLGKPAERPLPQPKAGRIRRADEAGLAFVRGAGFGLVFDKKAGQFVGADQRHTATVIGFPSVHVTRFDFGDLKVAPPHSVLPDEKTRVVESTNVSERPDGVEITVKEHYDGFAGTITWLIDRNGVGRVTYDYAYTGPEIFTREVGIRFTLRSECDNLAWRRWSEWGVFPDDHIGRTEGSTMARRTEKPDQPENVRPEWPWRLDQTELGTNDFRSTKFNIYEAHLIGPENTGLRIHANADAHVRACLAADGVRLHALSQCRLGPGVLKSGDPIAGERIVELVHP